MIIDRPTQQDIPALRALWQEAFGDPDSFLDAFFAHAFSPTRSLAAKNDQGLLGALYWFDCTVQDRRLAYIYAVAAAKAHRGKGLGRQLMAAAHEALKSGGYDGAVLVPAEDSLFAYYEKLGYQRFGGADRLECAAAAPVKLEKLDAAAYGRLRRSYLPLGAVVQEQENLALLSAVADFYAGADFLLCAAVEKDKLLGAELLGNAAAAPGIVAALGCQSGSFRIPGTAPFAMFQAFTDMAAPTYFGHALD